MVKKIYIDDGIKNNNLSVIMSDLTKIFLIVKILKNGMEKVFLKLLPIIGEVIKIKDLNL